MKIGFDAKRYFNNESGLGNYARWLVDGLAQRHNFDYHLYQPTKKAQNAELPIHYPKGLAKISPSLWRSWRICSQLQKDGIKLFHGLSNELPFGIHKTDIKTVVTIHDLIHKRYPEYYAPVDRTIYDLKIKYAQRNAHRIITPSEQTKKDLTTYYGTDEEKIEVVPLSAKPRDAKDSLGDPRYILCVSGFSKRKNIPRLIEAFNQLEKKDLLLVLAGHSGDTLEEVKRLTANNPTIDLKLNLPEQELHELYQDALFCVYPSLFEGFGIPILEAFSHGKTVATSNVSSMPEVGGDAALYFQPENTEDIAKKLASLLLSEVRISLEDKIPRRLSHFDSAVLLNAYESIYSKVLKSR